MAKFATIKDGIVTNIAEANPDGAAVILATFLPDIENVIEITEETGLAFIGGLYRDGKFQTPPPYQSWTFDEAAWKWVAPVAMPVEGGPWEWNESTGQWQLVTEFETA